MTLGSSQQSLKIWLKTTESFPPDSRSGIPATQPHLGPVLGGRARSS